MNRWTGIGMVALAVALIAINNREKTRAEGSSAVSTPANQAPIAIFVEVMSFVSSENQGRTLASDTLRNTGSDPIAFAKAFVSFDESIEDSYFSPHDIGPGVIAKADVYSPTRGGRKCSLVSVQDRNGNQAALQTH